MIKPECKQLSLIKPNFESNNSSLIPILQTTADREQKYILTLDCGSSFLKIELIQPHQPPEELGLDCIKHRQLLELKTQQGDYAFITINPQQLIAEITQALPIQEQEGYIAMSGANNILVAELQVPGGNLKLPIILANKPTLSAPFSVAEKNKLASLLSAQGIENPDQIVKKLENKDYYLIRQLLALHSDPQLVKKIAAQAIEFSPQDFTQQEKDQILSAAVFDNLRFGDLQGLLLRELKQIPLGFTDQNKRSLGSDQPQQIKQIFYTMVGSSPLPDAQQLNQSSGHSHLMGLDRFESRVPDPFVLNTQEDLSNYETLSVNDFTALIQISELAYLDEPGKLLLIMTDTHGKLAVINGASVNTLAGQIEHTPYMMQGIGTCVEVLLPVLDQDKQLLQARQHYDVIDQHIESLLKGSVKTLPQDVFYYPLSKGGNGLLLFKYQDQWQTLDLRGKEGVDEPVYIDKINRFFPNQVDKNRVARAILLGTVYGVRQKTEVIMERFPKLNRIAVTNGLVDKGPAIRQKLFSMALSLDLPRKVELIKYQGDYDTPLAIQLQLVLKFNLIDEDRLGSMAGVSSNQSNLTQHFLPPEGQLAPHDLSEQQLQIFKNLYQDWLTWQKELAQAGKLKVDELKQIIA
jgi:hypothetical protein